MKKHLILNLLFTLPLLCFLSCSPDTQEERSNPWDPRSPLYSDMDGDGVIDSADCNDSDATSYPGATEVCDDDLETCGGVADAGCNDDSDNYCTTLMNVVGSPAVCSGESGGAYPGTPGTDCNDGDVSIYPDATEICDGIDNQCPGDTGYGTVDEGYVILCDMAQIPAGCFDMGDHFNEGDDDELPGHNVCISAFKIDVHEVTNAEYKACVDAEFCSAPSNSSSYT